MPGRRALDRALRAWSAGLSAWMCGARRGRRGAAALLLAIALTACAAPFNRDAFTSESARVFWVGYSNLAARYVEPVHLGEVATAGLARLTTIDPAIAIAGHADSVNLRIADRTVMALPAPAPDDARGWARLTAEFLTAARSESPVLREKTPSQMVETVFSGALAGFDRYTRYAGRARADRQRERRDGFSGIGISLSVNDGKTEIVQVYDHTPASAAGLAAGDLITHVDGNPINGLEQGEIVTRIRGPIGSMITLTAWRASTGRALEVEIRRDRVIPPTVLSETLNGLLHIRVTGFNQRTAPNIERILSRAAAQQSGAIRGIVLDMRGNPGGLLDQAVALADMFLGSGRIASTRGRHPDSQQIFDAHTSRVAESLPIALLINGKSASAAEIVAMALAENRRAVVIGTTSFGKGSVQTIVQLPNDGEMMLTWSHLHGPTGTPLHRAGVSPALCTGENGEQAAALLSALRAGDDSATSALSAQGDTRPSRGNCPPNAEIRAVDVEIARYVLSHRPLYAALVGAAAPAIAAHGRTPAVAPVITPVMTRGAAK